MRSVLARSSVYGVMIRDPSVYTVTIRDAIHKLLHKNSVLLQNTTSVLLQKTTGQMLVNVSSNL